MTKLGIGGCLVGDDSRSMPDVPMLPTIIDDWRTIILQHEEAER